MFVFAAPRSRRKPSLTPMIDVVFLLLVFFMLAAQFGREGALNLSSASGATAYEGPPRLITILPDTLLLNGKEQAEDALLGSLSTLTQSQGDAIVLQARDGANVQRLSDIAQRLTGAGFTRLILVE